MRAISSKRRSRQAEAKPFRDALIQRVGECEACGASPRRPARHLPLELSNLCCHEIANGPNRQKALDKAYALLVLCWHCNGLATNKGQWPETEQLALLLHRRPEDYDLVAYNQLINPNAPNRITPDEVLCHIVDLKE